jgi:hypothetical protein
LRIPSSSIQEAPESQREWHQEQQQQHEESRRRNELLASILSSALDELSGEDLDEDEDEGGHCWENFEEQGAGWIGLLDDGATPSDDEDDSNDDGDDYTDDDGDFGSGRSGKLPQ